MSLDHERAVLGGIVPARKDLMMYAIQHLEEIHFKSEVPRKMWTMLVRYYDRVGGILPGKVLSDLLERSPDVEATKALLYEGYYEEIANFEISDHEFKYSVEALKELHSDQMTGEALVTAFEIHQRGFEVDGIPLKGSKDAREYAYQELGKIDRLDNTETAPEGDMRREGSDIIQEYMDRKEGKSGVGIMSGIQALDSMTGGFQNGELSLVCAYTNQGKSQLCTQTAWDTAVKQGRGVFFATSETVRGTVRRRIVARHSRLPQFEYPKGIDSANIKNGTLSPKEEVLLKAVVDDLDNNPNYGAIYIAQIPSGATNTYVETRMKRMGAEFDVGLGVWDYIALFKANVRRSNEREEFNQLLRETKVFTTTFNDGKGVPILSPWQIKREDFKEALKNGFYTLGALADTTEAEKSPDQIITMLRMPESKGEVTLQFLKLRDGEIPDPFTVDIDYRSTYLGDKMGNSTAGAGFF